MKSILHPSYWVEIPEGEFLAGISEEQRQLFYTQVLERSGYAQVSPKDRFLDHAIEKLKREERLTEEDRELKRLDSWGVIDAIYGVKILPPRRKVWLKRFYIARYRITDNQFHAFLHGTPAAEIAGALQGPKLIFNKIEGMPGVVSAEMFAPIPADKALEFCEALGARLPTSDEWEKAARGTDGRLYPWGNEWNENYGRFYSGQPTSIRPPFTGLEVDAFPQSVSPYGVWGMIGGYPELVAVPDRVGHFRFSFHGEEIEISLKGRHIRDSSATWAYLDYIVAGHGSGDWTVLRPVLDELP